MARSAAHLPLVLQAISGPDDHDPEVPSVPWQQAGPVELTGLQAAYWLGFPAVVAGGIRARDRCAGRGARQAQRDHRGLVA